MIGAALAALGLAWAGVSAGAGLTALWRASRRRAGQGAAGQGAGAGGPAPPRALLVRPCAGAEPGLEERLTSALRARFEGELELRFSVASLDDGAVPAIRRAIAALEAAGTSASLVVAPPIGPNRKTSQLAGAAGPERRGAVICADSDVDLSGLNLDLLLAPLRAGAGACWAPPVELGPRVGAGDRASQALLGGSLHSFPLLAGLDPQGLVGKLFAVRADALEAVGGFRALVRYLGEDMELARRLRAAGWRVEAAPVVARSMVSGRSPAEVVARYARWLTVIRAQRPALMLSYPALFFCWPLQSALLLATASSAPALSAIGLALASVGRLVVALGAARLAGRPVGLGGALLDMALADAVLALAWLGALRSRSTRWRGVALRIGPGGELRSEP